MSVERGGEGARIVELGISQGRVMFEGKVPLISRLFFRPFTIFAQPSPTMSYSVVFKQRRKPNVLGNDETILPKQKFSFDDVGYDVLRPVRAN